MDKAYFLYIVFLKWPWANSSVNIISKSDPNPIAQSIQFSKSDSDPLAQFLYVRNSDPRSNSSVNITFQKFQKLKILKIKISQKLFQEK